VVEADRCAIGEEDRFADGQDETGQEDRFADGQEDIGSRTTTENGFRNPKASGPLLLFSSSPLVLFSSSPLHQWVDRPIKFSAGMP